MAGTLETVETYLTAAQTAFAAGDYDTARNQAVLAQMEMAKLPTGDGIDGETTQYRAGLEIDRILANIEKIQAKTNRTNRRSIVRRV